MKIGLSVATQPGPGEQPAALVDRLITQVRHADRWGFETCVFTEHHQQPEGYFPSPLVIMGALSTITSRIRLATAVLLAPLYDPIRLAEDTALLDLFSKGRIVLGVGAGYAPVDFDAFGVDISTRGARTNDTLEVLRRAWTGQPFSYEGRTVSYDAVLVTPRPHQPGGPPIWVGGLAEASLRRAATLGNGWISTMVAPIGKVSGLAARYRELLAATPERTGEVTVLREAWAAESREAAFRQYETAALSTHRLYFELGRYDGDPRVGNLSAADELTLEAIAEDRFVIGSVDDVVSQLRRYRDEAGADRVVLRLGHPAGPDHDAIMNVIELIGREIIPHVEGSDW